MKVIETASLFHYSRQGQHTHVFQYDRREQTVRHAVRKLFNFIPKFICNALLSKLKEKLRSWFVDGDTFFKHLFQ